MLLGNPATALILQMGKQSPGEDEFMRQFVEAELGVVVPAWTPSTAEAKAGGSQVQDQMEPPIELLSNKQTNGKVRI